MKNIHKNILITILAVAGLFILCCIGLVVQVEYFPTERDKELEILMTDSSNCSR